MDHIHSPKRFNQKANMSAIPPYSQFKGGHSEVLTSNAEPPTTNTLSSLTSRGSSDNYFNVLIQFDLNTRVILNQNKKNPQWIVQRRTRRGTRWEAIGYCITKVGLRRVLKGFGYQPPLSWPEVLPLKPLFDV